jgi:alanine dehydrogenase
VHHGHQVLVETGAGLGANFDDADYLAAGAEIAPDASAVFAGADMIVKVKEPQAREFGLLRDGQILFTYLHLAAARDVADALTTSGAVGIAYETVTDKQGGRAWRPPMWS